MSITPRPADYLAQLDERGRDGYEQLLGEEHGSLALAAHRLAVTRCLAQDRTDVPTDRELYAAAHTIAFHVDWRTKIPPMRDLVAECEANDRLVLGGSCTSKR